MTHTANNGEPKILKACMCPLTAPGCVKRLDTDMALIEVTPTGLVLREAAPGPTPGTVGKVTAAPLQISDDCRQTDVPVSFDGLTLQQ